MSSPMVCSHLDISDYQPITSWADLVDAEGSAIPLNLPTWAVTSHQLTPLLKKESLPTAIFSEGSVECPGASEAKRTKRRKRSSSRRKTDAGIAALCGLLDGLSVSKKPSGIPTLAPVLERHPSLSKPVIKQDPPAARASVSKRYHPYIEFSKSHKKNLVKEASRSQRKCDKRPDLELYKPPVLRAGASQPPTSKPLPKALPKKDLVTSFEELCRQLEALHLSPLPPIKPAPAPPAKPAPSPVLQRKAPASTYFQKDYFKASPKPCRHHPYSRSFKEWKVLVKEAPAPPKASTFLFKLAPTFNFSGMQTWCGVPTIPSSPSVPAPASQDNHSSPPDSSQKSYCNLPENLKTLVIS